MGQVLIRNLDDALLTEYRQAAKQHGRSLEAELRDGLARARPAAVKPDRDALIAMSRALRAKNGAFASDVEGKALIREDRDGFRDA